MPIKLEVQRIGHGQDHVAIRHAFIECPPMWDTHSSTYTLQQERQKLLLQLNATRFLFQTVGAQIRGVARLWSATAEHLVNDSLHMAIPVTRMALLEGPPSDRGRSA